MNCNLGKVTLESYHLDGIRKFKVQFYSRFSSWLLHLISEKVHNIYSDFSRDAGIKAALATNQKRNKLFKLITLTYIPVGSFWWNSGLVIYLPCFSSYFSTPELNLYSTRLDSLCFLLLFGLISISWLVTFTKSRITLKVVSSFSFKRLRIVPYSLIVSELY